MNEPAEKDPQLAELERRLDETTSQIGEMTAQLARVEPLLRALLKRAPKRASAPDAKPRARGRQLTDEQLAAIRRKVHAPKSRRRKSE